MKLPVDNIAVPVLLCVGLIGLWLLLLPLPTSAGLLLQASGMTHSALSVAARKRVSPLVPRLLALGGVLGGLAIGMILLTFAGWQGALLGGALAVAGLLTPRYLFTAEGWHARFVRAVNEDTLAVLRMVYVLAAIGKRPVDEAVRVFAQSRYGQQSELADFLAECPPAESPVQFLSDAEIPGQALATLLLALRQASESTEAQRKNVLGQQMAVAVAELKQNLRVQAKRRAQTGIVVGVLILLPTLLLAVLAPPMLNMLQIFRGF